TKISCRNVFWAGDMGNALMPQSDKMFHCQPHPIELVAYDTGRNAGFLAAVHRHDSNAALYTVFDQRIAPTCCGKNQTINLLTEQTINDKALLLIIIADVRDNCEIAMFAQAGFD